MLINEVLLDEDVTETKDIMALADYVGRFMRNPDMKILFNKRGLLAFFTLPEIAQVTKEPPPRFKSKLVWGMMKYGIPEYSHFPLRFTVNHPELTGENELGSYIPSLYAININLDLINVRRNGDPRDVLMHEITHAFDDYKSNGHALSKGYITPDDPEGFNSYLMQPLEVNARFSQALWDLAVRIEKISSHEVYPAIEQSLNKFKLDASRFKDPKQHRRLVVRAYKFMDDVIKIAPRVPDKKTFLGKVKALIKKWTS